jgi:hypothetical protein
MHGKVRTAASVLFAYFVAGFQIVDKLQPFKIAKSLFARLIILGQLRINFKGVSKGF